MDRLIVGYYLIVIYSKEFGKVNCVAELKGWDILGIPVKAPLAKYPIIYTLPMLTISPNKVNIRHSSL
jgi:hypothetical protein